MSKPKPQPKAESTISPNDWNKFRKGWAKANETRTERQVFNDDAERVKKWRDN